MIGAGWQKYNATLVSSVSPILPILPKPYDQCLHTPCYFSLHLQKPIECVRVAKLCCLATHVVLHKTAGTHFFQFHPVNVTVGWSLEVSEVDEVKQKQFRDPSVSLIVSEKQPGDAIQDVVRHADSAQLLISIKQKAGRDIIQSMYNFALMPTAHILYITLIWVIIPSDGSFL